MMMAGLLNKDTSGSSLVLRVDGDVDSNNVPNRIDLDGSLVDGGGHSQHGSSSGKEKCGLHLGCFMFIKMKRRSVGGGQ